MVKRSNIKGTFMLGVCLMPTLLYAETRTLALAWEWPKNLGTPAWVLTLSKASGDGSGTQATPPLTPMEDTACQQATGGTHTAETWCATITCPEPGAYIALLQAGAQSLPSDGLTLGIRAGEGCTLMPFDQAVLAGTTPPTVPTPAPPLVPAAAQGIVTPTPTAAAALVTTPNTPAVLTSAPDTAAPDLQPPPQSAPASTPPAVQAAPPVPSSSPPPPAAQPPTRVRVTMQTWHEQFVTLTTQYQEALHQITQDYEATLQTLTRQPTPEALQQAEAAYQTAQQAQRHVYHQARRHWHKLYREWHTWLLRQQQAQTPPKSQ